MLTKGLRMSNPYSTPTETNDVDLAEVAQNAVRQLRIVTFALLAGVIMFAGVTLFINNFSFDADPDIMSWIGLGFAAIMIVNSFAMPRVVAANMIKGFAAETSAERSDADLTNQLLSAYRTQVIIASAILEGGAFLNLTMTMITPFIGNLVAVAVLMFLMFTHVPSPGKLQFWLQDRRQEIASL